MSTVVDWQISLGSLTTGEEPTYLGHGRPSWWFTDDDWSYHQYSVEKLFAMSRESLFLVAKVCLPELLFFAFILF